MDSDSQETLRRIEQNDAQFTGLQIGYVGGFMSSDDSDYSRLGAAIGNNNHLTDLTVYLGSNEALDISNVEFFDGLKRNSSINDIELSCNQPILVGGVGHEILKSCQKINNNLTRLCIQSAVLDNGGGDAIAETLRRCRNLKTINFGYNSITDEQLLPTVEAIKGGCNTSLEKLYLNSNRIGNAGCQAIATLLADTNCSLKYLNLQTNQISNEGATVIANSLANNTKLKKLVLGSNPFEPCAVGTTFCTVLCNTSSVNGTYRSNHTLVDLILSDEHEGQHADHLSSLRRLNIGRNKSNVAIKKILKCHPNIDIEPLFEWDAEGEQSLKALPYVIDWFKRAKDSVIDEDMFIDNEVDDDDYCVDEVKLSAIFQFVKAMPLLFVPISCIKVDDRRNNKRKRVEK